MRAIRRRAEVLRLYSKGCEYALRALICLAGDSGAARMTVREVCRRARIPEPFTRKMFQHLVRQRLLRAVPGPGGGYQFRCAPSTISLLTIITMVDGAQAIDTCVMGVAACDARHPCALHPTVVRAKTMLAAALQAKTLSAVSGARPRKACRTGI